MVDLVATVDAKEPQPQPIEDNEVAAERQTEASDNDEFAVVPQKDAIDNDKISATPQNEAMENDEVAAEPLTKAVPRAESQIDAMEPQLSQQSRKQSRKQIGSASGAANTPPTKSKNGPATKSHNNPLWSEVKKREPRIQKDAPRNSAAHKQVKYMKNQRCFWFDVHNETGRVRVQTTPLGEDRSHEDAARIARLCYVEAEAGACREDVLRLRNELYWQCRPKIQEDAPRNSAAHTKVSYLKQQQCFVVDVRNATGRVRMQTTLSGVDGSYEDAARIARLCYVKAEAGSPREEVLRLRDELYWQCRPKIQEDAPCTSAAHVGIYFCDGVYKFSVRQVDDTVDMQVSVKQANNIVEDAARIARLCFAELETGKTKDEVEQYRDGLCKRCQKRLQDFPDGFDPNKTFLNRDLFGNSVAVPKKIEVKDAVRPLADLEISDIEKLTSDDVCIYEREVGLSYKRTFEERLARLLKITQRNTISFRPNGVDGSESSRGVTGSQTELSRFLALPVEEQRMVSVAKLRLFERIGFVDYAEELTLTERRDQLKRHIRETRAQHCHQQEGKQSNFGRQMGLFETWARKKSLAPAPVRDENKDSDIEILEPGDAPAHEAELCRVASGSDNHECNNCDVEFYEGGEKRPPDAECTTEDIQLDAGERKRPCDSDIAEPGAKKRLL